MGSDTVKKFVTVVPLQGKGLLIPQRYEAVGNQQLQMEKETCFPILTAVSGYVQPGEDFRLIAVQTNTEASEWNCKLLAEELDALCRERGFTCSKGIEVMLVEQDEHVAKHVETFQRLIDLVEDHDELYACMTFGTKPLSTAVQMALQYAYRIKDDVSIRCIVYGKVDHTGGVKIAKVYDMTALVLIDEITRILAEKKIANPKETLDRILTL